MIGLPKPVGGFEIFQEGGSDDDIYGCTIEDFEVKIARKDGEEKSQLYIEVKRSHNLYKNTKYYTFVLNLVERHFT